MDQAKSLLTINYRLDSAERFVSSISDSQYYFFVGNHLNSNTVAQPYDNAQDTVLSAYYGMIFGKKIANNDVMLAIRRVNWQTNTAYVMYDHSDISLYDDNFYVVVHDGSQYDVFKCLENGSGGRSTVAPSRDMVSEDGEDFFYPTDGYRWKYMYSASDAIGSKFGTPEYFPVQVDSGVAAQAKRGAIDVIQVTEIGEGYENYLYGTFGVGDIRLNGDQKVYGISTPTVRNSNGFYDGCWLYISSGGGAGQYRMIESFTSNSTYNFVELIDPFDPSDPPQNGSVFEITPSVTITGDGAQTVEAKARAIIDSSGNTVTRIEMLNRGLNYNLASATILVASSVGVTSVAQLKPIYSPTKGHGSNPPLELGGKFVSVGVSLVGNESNTVITGNDYSQIGLIRNPKFKKVTLNLSGLNKDFSTNENVYQIAPIQLAGQVATTLNGNNELTTGLIVSSTLGPDIVKVGNQIIINYGSNYQIANVVSVSNTTITMDKAALFDTGIGTANIHLAGVVSCGLVDGFSSGVVDLTYSGEFTVGSEVIGAETGTHGTISSVKITDTVKSFDTFMQVYTYIGSMSQGNFAPDEQVYQIASSIARANFHSIEDDPDTSTKRIYVTNQIGTFNTSGDDITQSSEIKGLTSGAIANLTNKYLPDLVFGSGEIVYVENGESITRADEKTETFKIILSY